MKHRCRLSGIFLSFILIMTLPFAAIAAEAVITGTSDKTQYAGTDTIEETIFVDNSEGSIDIENVTFEGDIPEGYTAKISVGDNGSVGTGWNAKTDKVGAGDTAKVVVDFIPNPTIAPTVPPTVAPTIAPTAAPTTNPTVPPTAAPTARPTPKPTAAPTAEPTVKLTITPTVTPTITPTVTPGDGKSSTYNNSGTGTRSSVGAQDKIPDAVSTKTAPKTGDDNPVVMLVLALLLAMTLIGVVLYKRKRSGTLLALLMIACLGASMLPGAVINDIKAEENTMDLTDYTLKWEDNFDGAELNRSDWNVELHEPGWVNAELQAYVDSPENIYVEDGHLVLKPVKNGTSYTSGRVNTQGKHDFKYGYFEARAKVPTGKGYLPAFWLMPANESLYGQWPRCGEIDIMEVMGQETDLSYGTIHYGNPHAQKQGTYTTSGDFAAEYHTYGVEWEPGKIAWYIDGEKFYETNDWYSTTEGKGTVTYPAPFDQPFYVILNLAIGGSWVGYPDESTTFEDQEYDIDYVRVYQKDSYDEDVEAPEKEEIVIRDPDETGNYLINSGFDGLDPWVFATAQGGSGKAETVDGEILITTEAAGTETYGIQLLQQNVPVEYGVTYQVSFDAYADEARTGIVAIEGGEDSGWTRYLNDTVFEVGTDWDHYAYTFTMTDPSDATSVFEFNLGNTDRIAPIHIANVRLEKLTHREDLEIPVEVDGKEIVLHCTVTYTTAPLPADTPEKSVLSDGNYVYNGEFQEGANRMAYWDSEGDADVSVTPLEDGRRLKIVVNSAPVVIRQEEVPLPQGGTFNLSYEVQGDSGKPVTAEIAGQTFPADLDGGVQKENRRFATPEEAFDNTLTFTFDEPGTYYLDNVFITEDALIKNGSFNAGLSGWEAYLYDPNNAVYVVDSQTENNAFDITINNTGDQDWHIQLKQEGIPLTEGQCYKLSLDMKSSLDRKVLVAIQRDGNKRDNDWTPYVQESQDVGSDWQTYELYFKMNPVTEPKSDPISVLSISMGAVNNAQITDQHRICIDNVSLVPIDESEMPEEEIPEIVDGENLIKNGDFSEGDDGTASWQGFYYLNPPAEGSLTVVDGKATASIANVGSEDWNVQLKQFGIPLEKGESYRLTFTGSSTVNRDITVNLMSATYDWYAGTGADLTPEPKTFTLDFTMNQDTNVNSGLFISMGKTANAVPSTITLDDFVLEKVSGAATAGLAAADEETEGQEEEIPAYQDGFLEETPEEAAQDSFDEFVLEEEDTGDLSSEDTGDIIIEEPEELEEAEETEGMEEFSEEMPGSFTDDINDDVVIKETEES